jgi:hypothetical protein
MANPRQAKNVSPLRRGRSSKAPEKRGFRFRAECPLDVFEVVTAIGDRFVGVSIMRTGASPDVAVVLIAEGHSLASLKRLIRQMRYGHLMFQTIAASHTYTGERRDEPFELIGDGAHRLQLLVPKPAKAGSS